MNDCIRMYCALSKNVQKIHYACQDDLLSPNYVKHTTGLQHEHVSEDLHPASVIFNLPFAILPMQRAFASIATDIREAAWCCGLSRWHTFLRIELPLAWPGIVAALILVFVHTLGEFGVVLMIGGNIPGETRTASIAIYDYMQVLNETAAGHLSALLLACAFVSIIFINLLNVRFMNHGHND